MKKNGVVCYKNKGVLWLHRQTKFIFQNLVETVQIYYFKQDKLWHSLQNLNKLNMFSSK